MVPKEIINYKDVGDTVIFTVVIMLNESLSKEISQCNVKVAIVFK